MPDLSPSSLFAGLIFGGIGAVAWAIGRRRQQTPSMIVGVALMLYPWFVDDPVLIWVVGVLLTVAAVVLGRS